MKRSLLVVLALLLISSAAMAQGIETLAKQGGQGTDLLADSQGQPWDQPLTPAFEAAAEKYNVPIELLETLAYYGSAFENRGATPNRDGGYGLTALRDNILGGESLNEAIKLLGIPKGKVINKPEINIAGCAVVLSAYADQMGVDRIIGLEAWLGPVIRYAGFDEEDSNFFAYEVFDLLKNGLDFVNNEGEQFKFEPQDIGAIDLESLKPESLKVSSPNRMSAMDTISAFSSDYGPATWDPAASCNYSTATHSSDTIVIHTMEGTLAGTTSWFKNCAAVCSSHYGIGTNGAVVQYVLESQTAWHAGCYNYRSIGLEHEGYASQSSHPQALYDASAALCKEICNERGIPKAHTSCGPGICGHLDVNNCACGPGHTDPGNGWDWSYFIGKVNAGQNPPYLFDSNNNGWSVGHSATALQWTNCCGWSGIIYADQNGDDCFYVSPATNFTGVYGPQVVSVDVYPQNGTRATHDIKTYWKTSAENYYEESKSSNTVNYTAQNAWAPVNLSVDNSKWWNQTITGLRVDFDSTNSSTRWIVNHIVVQSQFWYHFSGNLMGWTAGHSLSGLTWTNCCGWPGILYADQTADDAFLYAPAVPVNSEFPFHYLGGLNDKIHVRVYPQNGNTANHDMAIYWTTESENYWDEAKSTHVNYTGQNSWADVILPVGANAKWARQHITQLRLDFDQVNHGNRWIVDYVRSEY